MSNGDYVYCPSCQAKDQVIAALTAALAGRAQPTPRVWTDWTDYDRTAHCPCRPENGGSGICNCIMGGPKITC